MDNISNKLNQILISDSYTFKKDDFDYIRIYTKLNTTNKNVNGIYFYIKDQVNNGITYPLYKHETYDFWIKLEHKNNKFFWLLFIPSKINDLSNIEIKLYISPILNTTNFSDGPDNHQTWIPVWNIKSNKLIPNIKINRILDTNIKNIINTDDNLLVTLSKSLHQDSFENSNPIEGIYKKIDDNIYVNNKYQKFLILKDNIKKEWKLVKIDRNLNILSILFYISFNHPIVNNTNIPLYYWSLKNIEENSEGIEQYDVPLLNYIHFNGYQTINVSNLPN
jgi:hypothetical protein